MGLLSVSCSEVQQSLRYTGYCSCSWLPAMTQQWDDIAEDILHSGCRTQRYQETNRKFPPWWLAFLELELLWRKASGGGVRDYHCLTQSGLYVRDSNELPGNMCPWCNAMSYQTALWLDLTHSTRRYSFTPRTINLGYFGGGAVVVFKAPGCRGHKP